MRRNYDSEANDKVGERYAYDFSTRVVHGCLQRSFDLLSRPESVRELWSFRGNFTERLIDCFDVVTCVGPSGDAPRSCTNPLHQLRFAFLHRFRRGEVATSLRQGGAHARS